MLCPNWGFRYLTYHDTETLREFMKAYTTGAYLVKLGQLSQNDRAPLGVQTSLAERLEVALGGPNGPIELAKSVITKDPMDPNKFSIESFGGTSPRILNLELIPAPVFRGILTATNQERVAGRATGWASQGMHSGTLQVSVVPHSKFHFLKGTLGYKDIIVNPHGIEAWVAAMLTYKGCRLA